MQNFQFVRNFCYRRFSLKQCLVQSILLLSNFVANHLLPIIVWCKPFDFNQGFIVNQSPMKDIYSSQDLGRFFHSLKKLVANNSFQRNISQRKSFGSK